MDLLFHRQIESDFRFLFLVLSGSENWRGFVMSDPLIGRFFSFEFWLLCDWLLLFTVYFWPDDAECGLIPKLGYFGRKNIFFIFGNIFGFQFFVIRRIRCAKIIEFKTTLKMVIYKPRKAIYFLRMNMGSIA